MGVLVKLWAFVAGLLDLPKIENEAGVKDLFQTFLDFGKRVAAKVPGKADDEFVAMLDAIVNDPEGWTAIYGYLVQRFGPAPAAPTNLEVLADRLAEISGLDFDREKILEFLRKLLDLISQLWA